MAGDDRTGLRAAAQAWLKRKRENESWAREQAVLPPGCGLDVQCSLEGVARERLALRLKRLIERERIRAGRPDAYDLERHLALKRRLDWLTGLSPGATTPRVGDARGSGTNEKSTPAKPAPWRSRRSKRS